MSTWHHNDSTRAQNNSIRNKVQLSKANHTIKHKVTPNTPRIHIAGHKRRRHHNKSLNPKPSKRAKTPQLIHDDDDDDYKETLHDYNETVLNTGKNHGFQFNSPQSTRKRRSDKEEMDDDDDYEALQTPIASGLKASFSRWSNCSNSNNTTPTRHAMEQINRYQKKLNEYTQIESELQTKYDRKHMDQLQIISEHKAHLLNEIDCLNAVNDGKRWYPMMHYSPSNKRYKPDVHRFIPNEYERYRDKLNKHIIKHRVADEMKDAQKMKRLYENTNEKMWTHLLKECEEIQKYIDKDGMFYHQGMYHQDGKIWWFKNKKRREEYANAITDLLNWYQTHTNNTFHDNKFGTILLKRCDEKNGDFAYVAEFKRVTIEEYEAYQRKFKKEMTQYCAKGDTKTMYNRVVTMRLKDNKRKLSDVYSLRSSKRRRISREYGHN